MLTNEVLPKAQEAEEVFLLLKLDTIKALDCLGWSFLTQLVEKIGVGPKFIKMVEAYVLAAVSIPIQEGFQPQPH